MKMDRQWMMISLVALILICSGCSEYTDNLAGSDAPEIPEAVEEKPTDTKTGQPSEVENNEAQDGLSDIETTEEIDDDLKAPLVAVEIPASDNENPAEFPASLPEPDPAPTVVSEPASPPSDEPAPLPEPDPPVVNEPAPASPTLIVSFCLVPDKKHSKSHHKVHPLTLACSPGKSRKTEILTVTFILYDQKADADEALWTETKTVEITNGVLLETLGLENPISEEFLNEDSKLSLGIQIAEEDEVEIWRNLWILRQN